MNGKKTQEKPMVKTKLREKDTVIKIAGKDKGKTGEIIAIDRKKGRVLVKGLNMRKMWQRPTQENPQGGSIELERPIAISNVMLYDSKEKKGTRVKMETVEDKKSTRKVRISKKSGKEI